MTEYTVGLLICGEDIAFIRKQRPDWQEGRLNGIGGHLEADETIDHCMAREFREETGYAEQVDWRKFAEMRYDVGTDGEEVVHFFVAKMDDRPELKSDNDEIIEWHHFSMTRVRKDFVPNLEFLVHVAMGLDPLTKLKEQFRNE